MPDNRIPPSDVEAEKVILGAILNNNRYMEEVEGLLQPGIFYDSANRRIFSAMKSLREEGAPIDTVTVVDRMKRKKAFEKGDDITVVEYSITISSPPSSIRYHSILVTEKAILRELINESHDLMNKSFSQNEDVFDLLEQASSKIERILTYAKGVASSRRPVEELAAQTANKINTEDDIVRTGFEFIDSRTAGLTRKSVSGVLAMPKHLKSTFSDALAASIVEKQGLKSAIISLEDPAEARVRRIIASRINVSLRAMRFKEVKVKVEDIVKVLKEHMKSRLFIFDKKDVLTPLDAVAVINETRPDFVVVDHIQKFKMDDMVLGIIKAINELETSAVKHNCHVMITSQVNDKNVQQRQVKNPQASDAQWTSALYQSSSEMFGLFYPHQYEGGKNPFNTHILEFEILASRYAHAIGKIRLKVNPDKALIEGEIG